MSEQETSFPSEEQWNEVRKKMLTSILVDTKIITLAEDLDFEAWPINDSEETPAKYIYYSLDQIQLMPEFEGQPHLIQRLYEILVTTISMDDPFDEISINVEEQHSTDYSFDDIFAKLDIDTNFPLQLISIPKEIFDVMNNMGVKNLKEFMTLSQKIAQKVHLKGDLRTYINAVVNVNESAISEFIPYRPKTKGLHLEESLGLIIKQLSSEERWALLHHYNFQLSESQKISAQRFSANDTDDLKKNVFEKFDLANKFFEDQKDPMLSSIKNDRDIMRLFLFLDDMPTETLASRLFKEYYDLSISDSGAVKQEKKKGFFASIFRR